MNITSYLKHKYNNFYMTKAQIKAELGYFPAELNNFDGDIPVGNVAPFVEVPKAPRPEVLAKFTQRLNDVWNEPQISEDAKELARELFKRANYTPSAKIQKIINN